MTFGKLTVLSKAPSKNKKTYWTCKCECGKIKEIQTGHLRNGSIKSCGCANKFGKKNNNLNSKSVINYRKRIKIALCKANGNRCALCGIEDNIVIYDFHHLDPSKKAFGITNNITKSKQAYADEAKKCVMLCSNCHRKIENKLISQDTLKIIFDEKVYFQTLDELILGSKCDIT